MTWKITYRDKHGKHAYEYIDSDNRSSLFKILTDKGISPIRIDQVAHKESPRKNWKKTVTLFIGALIFISVLIIVIFRLKDDTPLHEVKKDSKKTVSQIQVTPKKEEHGIIEKKDIDEIKKDRPTKVGEVVNGYVMLPSGRIHRRVGVVTNSIASRPKGKYAIFSRSCNNEIACYLTLKPGAIILGNLQHDGRFKKDFLESLKEPIIISDEDSQENAQLKRDVIEARLFLKDALDRGEDIEKIMQETRAELQDLMRVRIKHENLFREQLKNCETEQDVDDLFKACNKMLEEKGIAPLTYGPITKKNLLRQKANKEF